MSEDNTTTSDIEQESRILQPLTNFVNGGGDFALLLSYPNGMVKFHSSDAFNSYIDTFRRELNPDDSIPSQSNISEADTQIPNISPHYTSPISSSQNNGAGLKSLSRALEEPTFELQLSSETELQNHLRTCFREIQQLSCKAVAKAWIKTVEPKKQTRYPYNKGESTKPPWWPSHIRHCEPDHLVKGERIDLLVAIVRSSEASMQGLREATNRIPSLDVYKLKVLDEIYLVAQNFKFDKNKMLTVSDFDNGVRSHKRKLSKPNQTSDAMKRDDTIDMNDDNDDTNELVKSQSTQINHENETMHSHDSTGSITPEQLSLHPQEHNDEFISSSPKQSFHNGFITKPHENVMDQRYHSINLELQHHYDNNTHVEPMIGSHHYTHTHMDDPEIDQHNDHNDTIHQNLRMMIR